MKGWSVVHGSCYRLLLGSVTQSTAQANCLAIGGSLALVSSAAELAVAQAFIQAEGLGPTNGVWVDGSDAAQEGTWLTYNGDVMAYLGWTGPNGGANANCMRLHGQDVSDENCDDVGGIDAALCEL